MIKCYCYLLDKEDSIIIRMLLETKGIKVEDVAEKFEMSVPYINGIFEGSKFMPKCIYDYLVETIFMDCWPLEGEVYSDFESSELMCK